MEPQAMESPPEKEARFVVILQGATPWAGLADGVEGVQEALLRHLWHDPEGAVLAEVAAVIASLEDPETWARHGAGDGRPYWHWWFGYEGGSVTVQRLTGMEPLQPGAVPLRAILDNALGSLADCAEDLRRLAGGGKADGYLFGARHPTGGGDGS